MTAILAALVILLILVWAGQRRLIYLPSGDVPPPASVGLARAEPITFQTEDGLTLSGWFVPAAPPFSGVTVIVFNGNAGNRAYRAPLAARLAERGVSVLLFDYRGYGGHEGSPTEEGLARDARAARRYVATRGDVDPKRMVYFGESLGAGVAVRLAAEAHPLGLALRSPFTSMIDVGRHHYPFLPVRWLLRDTYASIDRIREVGCPLLVISAEHDSVVPAEQSRALYEAANEPKQLVVLEGVDHNDYELLAGERVIGAMVELVGRGR